MNRLANKTAWIGFTFSALCVWGGSTIWAGYLTQELRAVETSREARIRQLGDEEITQLRIALGRRVPQHRRAELYFRLAEIYMESYRAAFLVEGKVHEKRLEKGLSDKLIDRSYSRPYLRSGIKACAELVGYGVQFERSFDKMDQVYYFLGFNYGELEDEKNSSHYYQELVRKFPSSIFTAPAYKELGDMAYRSAKYRQAMPFYEAALKKFPEEKKPPLQHKLAWCYYRLKQTERGVALLKEAVAGTQGAKEHGPLRDEILRDLATFMTETGRSQEAMSYFASVSGNSELYASLLEKLGAQFERNAEPDQAIQVYLNLMKVRPDSSSAFRVGIKLVEIELNRKNFRQALVRLSQLKIPTERDLETQAAYQNLRILVRKTATTLHQDYRTKKKVSELEFAEGFYLVYLDPLLKASDPKNESLEIKMYLAEVKHELGKSLEEAELYREIVASKDPKFSKQAGLLWIGSLVKAMAKNLKSAQDTQGFPSPLEQQFIAATAFLEQSSSGEASNELRESNLRVAQILAGYKTQLPDALSKIKSILSRWPSSEQALTAAQLWLQLVEEEAAHKGVPPKTGILDVLPPVMAELRGNAALMAADQQKRKGKMTGYLIELDRRLQVARMVRLEHQKDYAAVAQGYEEFAHQSNQSDVVEKSYHSAVNYYLKTENPWASILRITDAWSHRFPKSVKAVEALKSVATLALIRGEFETCAQIFLKLGTVFHDAGSLETAGRIYEGLGQFEKALEYWDQYGSLYPNDSGRFRIALNMANLNVSLQKDPEASRAYKRCSLGPEPFQSECETRLADLYLRNQDVEHAKSLYQKVAGQRVSRTPQGRAAKKPVKQVARARAQGSRRVNASENSPYVAYARYRLAEMMETEPAFIPLKLPEAQLQKAVAQRLSFLGPLTNAYRSALDAGGPWAVTALNRLAVWVLRFSREIDAVEPPASAASDPKVLERFRKSLGKVSQPLQEKAQAAWVEAYTKAVETGLFSPVLPEIADHLADLKVIGRAQGERSGFQMAGLAQSNETSELSVVIENALKSVRTQLEKNTQDHKAWVLYGNHLWQSQKPLLGKIAFERALALHEKDATALNNLGVLMLEEGLTSDHSKSAQSVHATSDYSGYEEDWVKATAASQLFAQALELDDFFTAAKFNQAQLFNYYRMFKKSKPLWQQLTRAKVGTEMQNAIQVGLAISEQGLVLKQARSQNSFEKLKVSSFVERYHAAARSTADDCLSELGHLDGPSLKGFEKEAVELLKKSCERSAALNGK